MALNHVESALSNNCESDIIQNRMSKAEKKMDDRLQLQIAEQIWQTFCSSTPNTSQLKKINLAGKSILSEGPLIELI